MFKNGRNLMEKRNREGLIDLTLRSMAELSAMDLKHLKTKVSLFFARDHSEFSVTVFNDASISQAFYFYSFNSPEFNKDGYQKVIDCIKKDKFKLIVGLVGKI